MVSPIDTNTNPVSSTTGSADALASLTDSQQTLGKDAFLKLLVAQISHQDPLKPMDDTAFVAQLAQFSSLEQMMGINTRLDSLATQMQGGNNTALGDMVGKTVTVKGTMTSLDGSGVGAPISFLLGASADSVDVNIADSTGQGVRTMHLGAGAPGLVRVSWDGRNDDGLAQPPGAYTVSVVAKTAAGTTVDVTQETTGVLESVDFSKGYPNLQLDNGVSAPASDLLRIIDSANK